MIQFFKDAALTLPINDLTPKWISVPTKGGVKTTSVWLGDAYFVQVGLPVSDSDTTITVSNVDEFPSAGGTVTIDDEQITYTGVTSSPATITGCTRGANGTTAIAHTVGTSVFVSVTYTNSVGNVSILIGGMNLGPNNLSLSKGSLFGPPGVPLLESFSTILSGVTNAVQINLQLTAPAGPQAQLVNLALTTTLMHRPGDVTSGGSTILIQPAGFIYVQQRDQGLGQRLRLLPVTRKVNPTLPGFEWGQYRWRDNTTENAVAVVPTRWDIDTSKISSEIIGGVGSIGETNDLEPIDLEEVQSSIFMRAARGQYFTGVNRYYLPSDNFNLEFLPCYPGLDKHYTLLKPPKMQTPVFVGTWSLDSQGFYEYNLNARYTFDPNFDDGNVQPQFKVDRVTGVLTVNAAVQQQRATLLVGVLAGTLTESFNLPLYPVDKIVTMNVANPTISIDTFSFNRENGSVTFNQVPGTAAGQPVFAIVDCAIAVLYEYDVDNDTQIQNTNIPDELDLLKNTRLLTPDMNPAFSGLANGVLFLQHRVITPVAVTLAADKPQIAIPPTLSSIIGLIAYGPVFYNGDHALLTATAFGSLAGEVVPGALLEVIPGGFNPATGQPLQNTPFRGLINGLDPNTNDIVVVTGGDGIANLVFQPEPNFGFYIPTDAPWVTSSVTYTPTIATWTLGIATLTLSAPLSHKLAINTTIRLSGFTPSAWDGDYVITAIDSAANTIQFAIASDPGSETGMGTVGPLDTLLMPTPIAISQLFSGPPDNEGFLDFLYSVLSNDPLFGVISPTTGEVPFVNNGTVNGNVTITAASWSGQVSTLTLAASPTNLEVGQNIDVVGCTTSGLNGIQNVLSIFEVTGTWKVTATANTSGTGSESESGASFSYSNFRSNGVVAAWQKPLFPWLAATVYQVGDQIVDSNGAIETVTAVSGSGTSGSVQPTWSTTFDTTTIDNAGANQITWTCYGPQGPSVSVPLHLFDKDGNDFTSVSFDGNVVKIQFSTGMPNPSPGFLQAYLLQFLERQIVQMRVQGTSILSNSIMLQMQIPEQIVNNPYIVLSTDQTTTPPYYPFASQNSRFNINRLGIVPTGSAPPIPG